MVKWELSLKPSFTSRLRSSKWVCQSNCWVYRSPRFRLVPCLVYVPHEVVNYFTRVQFCATKNLLSCWNEFISGSSWQKKNSECMLRLHNSGFSINTRCKSGKRSLQISLPVVITWRVQTLVGFGVEQFLWMGEDFRGGSAWETQLKTQIISGNLLNWWISWESFMPIQDSPESHLILFKE